MKIGRSRRREEHNIKKHLVDIGWEDEGWIHLAEESGQWRALVNIAMKIWVP
jgi:hypothetical protein